MGKVLLTGKGPDAPLYHYGYTDTNLEQAAAASSPLTFSRRFWSGGVYDPVLILQQQY